MRARPAFTLAVLSGCAMLSGCAALGAPPRPRQPVPPAPSPVAQAQATHEYAASSAPAQNVPGFATPSVAIRTFATAYINWTAQTVSEDMRLLAADSVDQARAVAELASAQTAHDYELARGGIANRGEVEAIAPLAGRHDRYVVVTRELTSATATSAYQGLAPAWHVALATVVRLGDGFWAVSEWQPES